jgi:hypothetical protein
MVNTINLCVFARAKAQGSGRDRVLAIRLFTKPNTCCNQGQNCSLGLYHGDATPDGSAARWCVPAGIGRVVRLREAGSALVEPHPTNLSSVICHLSSSSYVDR